MQVRALLPLPLTESPMMSPHEDRLITREDRRRYYEETYKRGICRFFAEKTRVETALLDVRRMALPPYTPAEHHMTVWLVINVSPTKDDVVSIWTTEVLAKSAVLYHTRNRPGQRYAVKAWIVDVPTTQWD